MGDFFWWSVAVVAVASLLYLGSLVSGCVGRWLWRRKAGRYERLRVCDEWRRARGGK